MSILQKEEMKNETTTVHRGWEEKSNGPAAAQAFMHEAHGSGVFHLLKVCSSTQQQTQGNN